MKKQLKEQLVEQLCGRWGIVEPKVVGDTLIYYEWEFTGYSREYWKQEIHIPTGEFTKRTKLKRKPNWYVQHI